MHYSLKPWAALNRKGRKERKMARRAMVKILAQVPDGSIPGANVFLRWPKHSRKVK